MTNEAPDRIWYDGAFQHAKSILHRPPEGDSNPSIEYLRKDAACVEVREGFQLESPTLLIDNDDILNIAGEALTLRTVEDVRREALMEAVRLLELPSGLMTPPAAQRIRNLINTPAPSSEKAEARIAELEKKLEGMADLAVDEFSRAEKAEAHIVELDRELINIRRSRREAEAALTEARARLAAVWDEGFRAGIEAAAGDLIEMATVLRMSGLQMHEYQAEALEERAGKIRALSPSDKL